MSRAVLAVLLSLACAAPAIAESETQTYEKIARAPSAYARESYLRFTMLFEGIQDVDQAFAPIGRTSANYVQLIARKPRGARNPLPVFLKKSKSYHLRKLRNSPGNTYYLLRGRVRYFKSPVYNKESFFNMKGPTLKAEGVQSRRLHGFYGQTKVDKVEFKPAEGPKPAGYATYYILDILEVKDLPRSAKVPAAKPTPAQRYQPVRPMQIAARPKELAGKPISFRMRYSGRLGKLVQLAQGKQAGSRFALPAGNLVKESNLGQITDPTQGMQVLKPPGPLGKLVVISFGKDWDLAADLAKANDGDQLEVYGVLYTSDPKSNALFMFVLEGVKVIAGGGRPPGPPGPFGGRRRR